MTALPVGLSLAAAMVLLATPYGRDGAPAGTESGAEAGLPDSAAPDDFFAPREDTPSAESSPTTSPDIATANGNDRAEAPLSEPSDDAGSSGDGSGGPDDHDPGDASGDPAADVVTLVNEERAEAGCEPVRTSDALTRAAEKHSEDMAAQGYLDHESLDGTTAEERAQREGYHHWSGENIARGQTSVEAVMESWIHSRAHRANILNCENKAIGVGKRQNYWTQKFGSR